MGKMPIFPNMVVQMVTIGENTGNLDKMLDRIADFTKKRKSPGSDLRKHDQAHRAPR